MLVVHRDHATFPTPSLRLVTSKIHVMSCHVMLYLSVFFSCSHTSYYIDWLGEENGQELARTWSCAVWAILRCPTRRHRGRRWSCHISGQWQKWRRLRCYFGWENLWGNCKSKVSLWTSLWIAWLLGSKSLIDGHATNEDSTWICVHKFENEN